MHKQKRLKQKSILSFSFIIILLLSSIWSTIYIYSLPLTKTEEVVVGSYHVRGSYDIEYDLKSNHLYDNSANDRILYSLTTNQIDFRFLYGFSSNPEPVNTTIDNFVSFIIESDKNWNKTLDEKDNQDLFYLNNINNGYSFRVIPYDITSYVDDIDEEFGVVTENFTIHIIPYINTRTYVGGVYVDNVFEPMLKIDFDEISEIVSSVELGKRITISGDLKQTEVLPIIQLNNIGDQNVTKYRQFLILFFLIIFIIAVIKIYNNWEYLKTHIKSVTNRKNETINISNNQHKDGIIKANSQANDKNKRKMLCSLEELVQSGRYSDKKFEIFYIKEGDTIHEYVYSYTIINEKSATPNLFHQETFTYINEAPQTA